MGGCASKPKDLDTADKAPAPVEAPVETPQKVEAETVVAAQETKDGDASKDDKPVVKSSEAEKTEEAKAKPADEQPLKEAKVEADDQEEQVKEETPKEVVAIANATA